jgi:nucleotide-binding universal stress UspA family protein
MNRPAGTILLAHDLSSRSDRPARRAAKLADSVGARLVALHVIDADEEGALPPDRIAGMKQTLSTGLPLAGSPVELEIGYGPIPRTVPEVAKRVGADLIVTGVTRYDGLGDYFLGTTVHRIVRHANAPVLVVKCEPDFEYDEIVVATDFSECSAHALRAAATYFPQARLALLHAFHVPYEGIVSREAHEAEVRGDEQGLVVKFLEDARLPPGADERIELVMRYGGTDQVFAEVFSERGVDLVVLGTHGCGGIGNVLLGSTAETLLSWMDRDVLMVRQARREPGE